MKKTAAIAYLFAAAALSAAPATNSAPATNVSSAEAIRAELMREIPECDTVSENAARLLLQNSPASPTVTAEWEKFCGTSKEYYLFKLGTRLNEIGPTSPEINQEMWNSLKAWSKSKTGMRRHPQMSALLHKLGNEANPTNEDGKLLKTWYTTGYTPFMRAVGNAEKSRLYTFYAQDRRDAERGMSMSIALQGTYWIPAGNLSRLGNHPGIGMHMHVGYDNFFFGFVMDFRFSETPSPYNFYNENTGTLEQNSQFLSIFIGPDFKWAFLNFTQLSLLAVTGFGYDMISHYSVPRYSRLKPAYSDSFNVNAGLGLRYYFSADRDFYVESEVRIHRTGFKTAGTGGDDISGHYYTAAVLFGYKLNFNDF